jgi:hypothetical protein
MRPARGSKSSMEASTYIVQLYGNYMVTEARSRQISIWEFKGITRARQTEFNKHVDGRAYRL